MCGRGPPAARRDPGYLIRQVPVDVKYTVYQINPYAGLSPEALGTQFQKIEIIDKSTGGEVSVPANITMPLGGAPERSLGLVLGPKEVFGGRPKTVISSSSAAKVCLGLARTSCWTKDRWSGRARHLTYEGSPRGL